MNTDTPPATDSTSELFPIENVGATERAICALGGAVVAGFGIGQRNFSTPFLLLLGGALVYRGISGNCKLYEKLGINTAQPHRECGVPGNKGIRVEKSIAVNRHPAQVFSFWRNLENLPRFMPHLKSVKQAGQGLSHWKVEGPAGMTVEWDAEIINEHPGKMISWRSLPGAQVQSAGTVRFHSLDDGKNTLVTVVLQYQPPGGRLGAAVAAIFGEAPDQQLDSDLQRFRDLVESEGPLVTM